MARRTYRRVSSRRKPAFRRNRRPTRSARRAPSRRRSAPQTLRIVIEQPSAIPLGKAVAPPMKSARFP